MSTPIARTSGFVLPSIPRASSFYDDRSTGSTSDHGACFIVSHEYRFIFLKLGKNGGSSVAKILKEALCGPITGGRFGGTCNDSKLLDHGQHQRNREFANFCVQHPPAADTWQQYFKFVFVRDPAERRVSMVEYCGVALRSNSSCERCAAYFHSTKLPLCGICTPFHCKVQHESIFSHHRNSSYVDYIGRVDTLQMDMEVILREISRRYDAASGNMHRGIQWANKSIVTGLTANVHSSAYIRKADKRPAPLNCSPDACLAATNNATQDFYRLDAKLFGKGAAQLPLTDSPSG